MKENIIKKNELLNAIANEGVRIIEIWEPGYREESRFFETGDFRPANRENQFHELTRCKEVSNIINQQKSIFANSIDDIRSVTTAIEQNNSKPLSKKFSKDFLWVWHTS